MLKLEREECLDPKQVIQLITEGHLSPNSEIARAYSRLEAIFYEKEMVAAEKKVGNGEKINDGE